MRTYLGTVSVLAGGLLLATAMIGQASAGHGGGGGGLSVSGAGGGGGGGGGHVGGAGGGFGGVSGHSGHMSSANAGGLTISGTHSSRIGKMGPNGNAAFVTRENRFNNHISSNNRRFVESSKKMGRHAHNDHDHDDFDHHHRHFHNNIPWWWNGYAYDNGYDCDWLRRRALTSGSGYWWNRYYACVNQSYY